MSMRIPQAVALRVLLKAFLSSDHITAGSGLTIPVQISKNGGAFGNPSAGATNATEIANGWYYVDLSAADAGVRGPLIVRGTEATIDPTETHFQVIADPTKTVVLRTGTAQAGSGARTLKLDAGASTVDNIYRPALANITAGTGVGQTRRIVSYDGTTKIAVVDDAWSLTPDGTSAFELVGAPDAFLADQGVAQAGGASSITLATTARSEDDIYNNGFVVIVGGTGSGQVKRVTDYVGSTRVATVDSAWSVNPDSTSAYVWIPSGANVSGGSATSASEIALAVFTLDLAGVTGEAARSLLNAVRLLRNRWTTAGGALTVYKEDDATAAWTAAITTTTGATPVTSVDPD